MRQRWVIEKADLGPCVFCNANRYGGWGYQASWGAALEAKQVSTAQGDKTEQRIHQLNFLMFPNTFFVSSSSLKKH